MTRALAPRSLRQPVLVGAGQLRSNRARTVDGAREPLALVREALAAAERDAGVTGLLRDADAVYAVHIASWAYDGLAAQVGSAVGARPRTLVDTGLGGHLPVRLLEQAAARIWSGDSRIALLVGAEAQASVSLLGRAGVDPVGALGWSAQPGGPPAFDLDQLGSTAMQAAGLVAPTRVYPLIENRLQADLGRTPAEALAESARIYAVLSEVAAAHAAAWERAPRSAAELAQVGEGNRMVCEPYPLTMNAMPHVDQAAAVVVLSWEEARARGIPDSALLHVWGGAGVDDDPDVLARPDLGRVPAIGEALDRCLAQAGLAVADVDLLDVYSCFPVVPKLVARHLGLDAARLSVTGGHSSFGGPLNSYALHSIATLAQRLRTDGGTGLVHGNGGYATYQHALLLGDRPHESGYVGSPEPRTARTARPARSTTPLAAAAGAAYVDAVVETCTVEHDRGGSPSQAFLVSRLPDGTRVASATPAGDAAAAAVLSLAALPPGLPTHVGRPVRLHPHPDGTSTVTVG